ncbi:UNKNOWN [Stylonychia lemnae]|uniref:Uncharacterized protein n=1 Tax=Stylonychia lemnae TaxID=5949 RepID=A0A078ACU0_STYLE|nr:UNKNOWN [Stylonychia lemnae]|eukprot:CDW80014.1 UNKNOWN [Stylonychia lemnae]
MDKDGNDDIIFGGSVQDISQTLPLVGYFQTESSNVHVKWVFSYKDANIPSLTFIEYVSAIRIKNNQVFALMITKNRYSVLTILDVKTGNATKSLKLNGHMHS